jgi:hypothetical protein
MPNCRLYSDKHCREIKVEYECVSEADMRKITIWLRPERRGSTDPPHEHGYQATFLREPGGFIRATMLDRNGFESLKGVSYDLLARVAGRTGCAVRSSLMLDPTAEPDDRDDQLQDCGIRLWWRFEHNARAVYDERQRRFHLLLARSPR